MKIAVFSDSHDHIWHMRKAVQQANRLGAEKIIHCGDLVSPFMLEELDFFYGEVHLVFGNNTGDQFLLTRNCLVKGSKVDLQGWMGRLELDSVSLLWVHDPHIAESIARSNEYQVVCFGHTHRWRLEQVGRTLLLNPGELLGRKEPPGWGLLDTEKKRVEHILLDS
ncbi:MAG TPA: YfcE family phosphodiesterase [Thermodesulfobacteriaceae bacterium]|nr:YfcE family phosphodiesterase [Thermodesulfobacteriaceae bacterium]